MKYICSKCGKDCETIESNAVSFGLPPEHFLFLSACCKVPCDNVEEYIVSLRDQFAMAAMGALTSFEHRERLTSFADTPEASDKLVAESSYRLADAMMKERGK